MKKLNQGFTLIELMIVVSIIGILGAVGYPAYGEYVKIGKRADAMRTLLAEQRRIELFYNNNDTYAGFAVADGVSDEGFYTIALSDETAFVYKLTATRSPADDDECKTFTLNQLGEKGATGTKASECWN